MVVYEIASTLYGIQTGNKARKASDKHRREAEKTQKEMIAAAKRGVFYSLNRPRAVTHVRGRR